MDTKKLADLLYPNAKPIEYWLEKYPKRNLPNGAEVTRISPSPTGYLHIGHAYSALISKLTAMQTNGIFYFRLEDTDQKRLVENAGDIAYNMLTHYNLKPDEGYRGDELSQIGDYGDYIQSLIKKHNLSKHIIFTGPLNAEQICAQYLSANVFICPSSIENSPNSLGEAQLLGVPCIASDVGGVTDMIPNKECGIIYRFEEVELLAKHICEIFKTSVIFDNSEMQRISHDRHDKVINAKTLINIYKSIII